MIFTFKRSAQLSQKVHRIIADVDKKQRKRERTALVFIVFEVNIGTRIRSELPGHLRLCHPAFVSEMDQLFIEEIA